MQGCCALALVLLAPASAAGELRFALDPGASELRFTLGATMHQVEGSFRFTEGSLALDPAAGTAQGRLVVDARTGNTKNAKRDRDMHAKVLESSRHPEIVFEVGAVRGALAPPGGAIELEGVLELHGGRHALKLPAQLELDGSRATVSGSFSVPYVEWGLRDPSMFVLRVEKRVEVTFRVVGSIAG
jgi:polyisoprenoid-binding protein YceI